MDLTGFDFVCLWAGRVWLVLLVVVTVAAVIERWTRKAGGKNRIFDHK
jgi:hypothetical protein